MKKDHNENASFTLIDIVRILGGILLLNSLASWWFTSTSTWGYDGKWINPRYLKHRVTLSSVNLTIAELAQYDGENSKLPIYIAINGSVYDVTSSPHIYGPKGPYRFFSGKDAARAFVTGCFQKPDEFTYDLREIDAEEAESDLRSWQNYFENSKRYWFVGTVQHEPLEGDPPLPCQHVKFPH